MSFYQVLLPVLAPRNLIFLIVQWLLESSFIFCLKKEEKVAFLLELQNSLARVADPDPEFKTAYKGRVCALKLKNFEGDANPNTAFHCNSDRDPASKS